MTDLLAQEDKRIKDLLISNGWNGDPLLLDFGGPNCQLIQKVKDEFVRTAGDRASLCTVNRIMGITHRFEDKYGFERRDRAIRELVLSTQLPPDPAVENQNKLASSLENLRMLQEEYIAFCFENSVGDTEQLSFAFDTTAEVALKDFVQRLTKSRIDCLNLLPQFTEYTDVHLSCKRGASSAQKTINDIKKRSVFIDWKTFIASLIPTAATYAELGSSADDNSEQGSDTGSPRALRSSLRAIKRKLNSHMALQRKLIEGGDTEEAVSRTSAYECSEYPSETNEATLSDHEAQICMGKLIKYFAARGSAPKRMEPAAYAFISGPSSLRFVGGDFDAALSQFIEHLFDARHKCT
eukprot:gene26444-31959_t